MEYNPCTGAVSYNNSGERTGVNEVVPEAIREWIQEGETGNLIIFFQNGERIWLSPKAFDPKSGELVLNVQIGKNGEEYK